MTHRTTLQAVDPPTLKRWLDEGRAELIDVREPMEHARERIAGARLAPLSVFDGADLAPGDRRVAVFHCRSGNRTAQAADRLLATGFDEVYHLDGGIEAWKGAGLPVQVNRSAPIDLMRQVQIAAGSLVLLGVALGLLVTPWFLALSAFVGAGLVFAGVTGFCGMARLLARMPWNRVDARPPRRADRRQARLTRNGVAYPRGR
jgi:rhodanese-related sulfurtransferase